MRIAGDAPAIGIAHGEHERPDGDLVERAPKEASMEKVTKGHGDGGLRTPMASSVPNGNQDEDEGGQAPGRRGSDRLVPRVRGLRQGRHSPCVPATGTLEEATSSGRSTNSHPMAVDPTENMQKARYPAKTVLTVSKSNYRAMLTESKVFVVSARKLV